MRPKMTASYHEGRPAARSSQRMSELGLVRAWNAAKQAWSALREFSAAYKRLKHSSVIRVLSLMTMSAGFGLSTLPLRP
jgi:hypothetical protein